MKYGDFLPLLAPNQKTDIYSLQYSLLASEKLDGIRSIFFKGDMITRSLKEFPNKQIKDKFEEIRKYSEKNDIILDGECYAPNVPFGMISSCCMTEDWYEKKSVKAWEKLQLEHHLKISREEVLFRMSYYIFDTLKDDPQSPFIDRLKRAFIISNDIRLISLIKYVPHYTVSSPEKVIELFEKSIDKGLEGLILRNPSGIYKWDRATLNQNIIYKVKPWETLDAQIIEVVQSTKVNPDAEKKINEKGYSVTSKKKDDRILIDKAEAFIVKYEGMDLEVPLANMKAEDEKEIWLNREKYIGRWIEYKFMKVGMKEGGLPRIPGFVRFREDKDE